MAKLNGVKTIDMVNGEITKVAYNVAEYVKTNEPVRKGDLFQLREGHYVYGGEVGAFYTTDKFSDGDVVIPTEYKGNATYTQTQGWGVAYRKVSAQTAPTIEERVEELEAEVAKLKAQQTEEPIETVQYVPMLKAGDFVKFVKEGDYSEEDITLGKAYEIEDVSELGFYDDNDDFRTAPLAYAECYEILVADEVKWSKVNRKSKEYRKGDIVRVIEDVCAKPVGTIFEVKHASRTAVSCEEGYAYGVDQHIELITPVDDRFDK